MDSTRELPTEAVWRDSYGGFYVTPQGDVFSRHGRKIRSRRNRKGYHVININARHGLLLARVVCESFKPNPNQLPQVNHIDENKDNNCISNLEWCDNLYNLRHGTRTERAIAGNTETMRKRYGRRIFYNGEVFRCVAEFSAHFGICRDRAKEVVRKKTWRGLPISRAETWGEGGGGNRIPRPKATRAHRAESCFFDR